MTGMYALIIDCGSQVTALIARCLREMGVYCEIHPLQRVDASFLERCPPQAIIISGGPASVSSGEALFPDVCVFEAGVPVLGICYGQQAMVEMLGGRVDAGGGVGEFGPASVRALSGASASSLLRGWFAGEGEELVWMSHGDRVSKLPEGFVALAQSDVSPFTIIADESRHFYGVQFHPEVSHTPGGKRLLRNFTHEIAGMAGDWSMSSYRSVAVGSIRDQVGDGKVVCGLSGGVDSAVAAVLIHEAIGDDLTCIFVDTGLMRQGEAEQVLGLFRGSFDIPLVHVDAGDDFLIRLRGVTDPEEKRKIIGRRFVEIFELEALKLGGVEFLAQGTLYPDVIESVSPDGGASAAIKSHHNVGGLPERMKLRLLEPLRRLFKDEVRILGRELGLPEGFVGRHPFPGPGLGIRVLGEVTRDRVEILRQADAIYLEEICKAGLYEEIWQAFAVLLPVCSVGVMGDGRSYEQVLGLRAVKSSDGMTAEYYGFEHKFLRRVSVRLVNEVRGINRVVYDVTSKPPGTIEWE